MGLRIFLFILTNLAFVLVIGIGLRLAGVDHIRYGYCAVGWQDLLTYSAIVGFAGSIFSLAISKRMALWSVGAHIIDAPQNDGEVWLLNTVKELAERSGIGMPDVAIYESHDMNAFATGMFRNRALVAVSTGLIEGMREPEVEAVLAHEVTHVANGDMVTMALLQGVMNTFVVFLSRVIGSVVDAWLSGRDEDGRRRSSFGLGHIVSIVAEITLGIFAAIIMAWFSRRREFRADAGAAALRGPESMIGALNRLREADDVALPTSVKTFGIHGSRGGLAALFASHPSIDARIEALRSKRV